MPVSSFLFVSCILVLAITIFTIEMYKNRNYFDMKPSYVFLVCWVCPLLLLPAVSIVDYYSEFTVTLEFLVFVIAVSLSFIVGSNLSDFLFGRYTNSSVVTTMSYSTNGVISVLFLLAAFGVVSNVYNVISAGGLSVYTEQGARAAELTFGSSTVINYLYFLNGLLFPYLFLKFVIVGQRKYLFVSSLCFFSLFFHGTKSTIVYPIIILAFSLIALNRSLPKLQLTLVVLMIFISFQLITILRNLPFIDIDSLSLLGLMFYKSDHIIAYLLNGYVNLQQELLFHYKWSYGAESFQVFVDLYRFFAGEKEGVNHAITETPFNLYYDAFNTGSFLREYFRDFGVLGSLFITFFIGFIFQSVYHAVDRTSISGVMILAIVCLIIFSMPFSNQVLRIQYWYWIGLLVLLSHLPSKTVSYDRDRLQ